MSENLHINLDSAFTFTIPTGWTAERDPENEGVIAFHPEGPGLLHLVAFPQAPGEMPDPAEELYAFLEDDDIELEEDDVEDVQLPGGGEMSICEYLTEDEDDPDEPATYWMIAVATVPGNLVLGSYSCPAGAQASERDLVQQILGSLQLREFS